MQNLDYHVYYWAGIGVIAFKFGIRLEWLSIGDEHGQGGRAVLEPLEDWCDPEDESHFYRVMQIEEYVTTLLAGSAASFVRVQNQRSHYKCASATPD